MTEKYNEMSDEELVTLKQEIERELADRSRWSLWPQMNEANLIIKKFSDKDRRLFYFDSASPLLGNDGKPDTGFFLRDKLHLNKKGYDAWTSKLKPMLKKAFHPR